MAVSVCLIPFVVCELREDAHATVKKNKNISFASTRDEEEEKKPLRQIRSRSPFDTRKVS